MSQSSDDGLAPIGAKDEEEERAIAGERGQPTAAKAKPLQSRIRAWIVGLTFAVLALVFMGTYYARVFHSSGTKPHGAARTNTALETESKPTPLGPLPMETRPAAAGATGDPSTSSLLGSAPQLPAQFATPTESSPAGNVGPGGPMSNPAGETGPAPPKSAWRRRLESPVLLHASPAAGVAPTSMMVGDAVVADPSAIRSVEAGRGAPTALTAALQPTVTATAHARVLPTRRWLLPKGAFVDCTLETAIDSQLAGLTTCVTAVDVLSADGTIVLLERGTKLVGEARADVHAGQSRVFVLWNEARTPTGVVAELASPGTDSLGRSGVPGAVDTHFADRFGAAMLVSLINGAVQAAANRSSTGGTVVVAPQASTEILTEVLRNTISIPPTITIPQGTRIQVLVARDVDFRDVYALKSRS
jgi:type IV secretion system protein VirB10